MREFLTVSTKWVKENHLILVVIASVIGGSVQTGRYLESIQNRFQEIEATIKKGPNHKFAEEQSKIRNDLSNLEVRMEELSLRFANLSKKVGRIEKNADSIAQEIHDRQDIIMESQRQHLDLLTRYLSYQDNAPFPPGRDAAPDSHPFTRGE